MKNPTVCTGNVQSANLSPEQKYFEFLQVLGIEIDGKFPGVFEWRFGKPAQNVVDGLIITKADVDGYVFVVGTCHLPGSRQGGVWREGGRHDYSASIMAERDWEHPNKSHWEVVCLEARCSADPVDVVKWIAEDWAFERPWTAPLPIDLAKESKRLQKVISGLKSRSDLAVLVEAKAEPGHNLTPDSEAALKCDLAGLLPELVRDGFPADNRGAFALKTTVVLADYETTLSPGRDRKLSLVVVGPQRRSDPQVLRINLRGLIPANQDHRWDDERWRWHADSANEDRTSRWGAPVPVESLVNGNLSASQLAKKVERGTADVGQKAALAILLQTEGRLLEAIELYSIEIDEILKRLCGGQKIYPPACCAYADEKWVEKLQDWLRTCAPWLLGKATAREAERIAGWAAQKSGRKRRHPSLKLLIFPGQHHSRKVSLILTSTDAEGVCPRLTLQATASNARLHESAWRRSLELDFARHQLTLPPGSAIAPCSSS